MMSMRRVTRRIEGKGFRALVVELPTYSFPSYYRGISSKAIYGRDKLPPEKNGKVRIGTLATVRAAELIRVA